jgi:triosephosphate isomerase
VRERLDGRARAEVVLCPPFTALSVTRREIEGSSIALGAQNMHWEERGAFTGEISPDMLLDIGCRYVILGHSERRHLLGETDEMVRKKLLAALRKGLSPILCVGETWPEREAGRTEEVVGYQIRYALSGLSEEELPRVTVAYEPVWAIGTGRAATPEDAVEVIRYIRELAGGLVSPRAAEEMRVLYGGSVTPDNMGGFADRPEIDGALVGGASLDAASFAGIVEAVDAARSEARMGAGR